MNETAKAALTEDIRTALRLIIDPEIGRNIVDLGTVPTISWWRRAVSSMSR